MNNGCTPGHILGASLYNVWYRGRRVGDDPDAQVNHTTRWQQICQQESTPTADKQIHDDIVNKVKSSITQCHRYQGLERRYIPFLFIPNLYNI
jgi:copper oxidase (laccase) domain-containing protein